MKIIQASFFWQNDKPGGLGFTFGMPGYSSEDLARMFDGPILRDYLRDSDHMLGTIELYISQLVGIAEVKASGKEVAMHHAVLAAYNIIWLTERGFIPNDEYNGYQFIKIP